MGVKVDKKNISFDFEKNSFAIITYAGKAKSLAMEAISIAKKGQYKMSLQMIDEANQSIVKALQVHMMIIAKEGQGYQLPFSVLFMHAEDQLMTTQMIIEISKEFINLYEFMQFKNN